MYRDQHLTATEIARRTGLSQPTVSERLRSAGVAVDRGRRQQHRHA